MKNYHKNPRQIKDKQFRDLRAWLAELGDLSGIVHDLNTDEVISGNQRMRAIDIARCEIVLTEGPHDPDAQGTVAHGYVLWQGAKYNYRQVRWTAEQCEKANIVANKAGGSWDFDILANEFEKDDLLEWGFEDFELGMFPDDEAPDDPGAQVDRAEELREKWGVETGQLWQLGEHRLICGDCTDAAVVARVMGGEKAQAIVTDPPYCSGGFQEAGKKSGSIGTRGDEMIANDTLSTRGYIALMKAALSMTPVGVAYVFTDWRMWITLFDVIESLGFGVRQMIVWDKGTPGMGRGWRSQHELIIAGMRVTQPFDPHKAQGNVIRCERTGNVNHATEKPVELVETILGVTDMALVVYDPFLGSGTTLIACERLGRRCRAIEISPAYCAVALQRWADMTGGTPELVAVRTAGNTDA